MKLSEKIYIIRRARRYTQEDLAYKIGITRQTVSDWENENFEPTLDNIRALSQVLDVSFDTLLNDKIDLKDKDQLNRALKNLDNDTKGKINNSFRYRICAYTLTNKDYINVILYFSLLIMALIGLTIFAFFIKGLNYAFIIEMILLLLTFILIGLIPLTISNIKKIKNGGYNHSFGTLSQTHLVIIGWSDSKFDRTIYIPVTEIENMELHENATSKHGSVIVNIKGKNKPVITGDIVNPQKLIDVFNNLETFIDISYAK